MVWSIQWLIDRMKCTGLGTSAGTGTSAVSSVHCEVCCLSQVKTLHFKSDKSLKNNKVKKNVLF